MKNPKIIDYRCKYCQKLLFKAFVIKALIEIKCKACKNINEVFEDKLFIIDK